MIFGFFSLGFFFSTFLWTFTVSECPNGCSGNGDCGVRDQCDCYIGYTGNDCSELVCPFGYAHIDTPKGDLNMDGSISSSLDTDISTSMYKHGAVEGFPSSASSDEAHFYMECSNNGVCDRTKGSCECFPAYEGFACQRQTCPNECSGHGTCESMSKLASKAGGTLFGNVEENGATTYTLWDAELIHGCRCDPWYSGPDCSQRTCKVGIDPLYGDSDRSEPIYDSFYLRIGNTGSTQLFDETLSTFRLRLFDYYGEAYVTEPISIPIPITDTADLMTNIETAVSSLSTSPFPSFTCADVDAAVATTNSANQVHNVICSFPSNPGKLRLPELVNATLVNSTNLRIEESVAMITGTPQRGEDSDWTPTYVSTIAAATQGSPVDFSSYTEITTVTTASRPVLVRIQDQYLIVDSTEQSYWSWQKPSLTSADRLYMAPAATVSAGLYKVDSWTVGSATFIADVNPSNIARGDWIFYENQIFKVLRRFLDGTDYKITVDRPFFGTADAGADVSSGTLYFYEISPPATAYAYVGECAFKGICDKTTGLCDCFKGYTTDNCHLANAIAL